jgi:precorrin-3B C17-methyltransferase
MINVIGIGQNRDTMTLGALEAIKNSDVIVGYKNYIEAISDLVEGKEIIKKGMGDEVKRVEMAISRSLEGKNVSLISSGDPGVFGMANVLFQIASKYDNLEIKVYPGVSALNYSASQLGAPLHDFAAISLSNLLTPLSEIKTKLEHALKSNLIISIYNPISKTRKEPFKLFMDLTREIRGENTLIGIVNSESYPSKIKILKLKDLNPDKINMFTCLIVGNKMTYEEDGHMITSRGYVIKEPLHPMSVDFYERFLGGETPVGPNRECAYYPCHEEGQYCDFCYCPFYPCGDPSTGGRWIKNKNVWSCEDCMWVHEKKNIDCIKPYIYELVEEPKDLVKNKKALLKLRRACILKDSKVE